MIICRIIGVFFTLSLIFTSCQEYTPKPIGYNRIEPIESEIEEHNFSPFSFEYPSIVKIDTLKAPQIGEIWFNITYPPYNAVIYCTYLPIDKSSLSKAIEDSYHLAYSHTLKASNIEQNIFNNSNKKTSGIVYQIEGSVATPVQFYVTDSTQHFLRGSFYYSNKVNADSVAPITEYITRDIEQMLSSFKWK